MLDLSAFAFVGPACFFGIVASFDALPVFMLFFVGVPFAPDFCSEPPFGLANFDFRFESVEFVPPFLP